MNLREMCYTESGPFLRPFSPNANWESAQVFVVGTNPSRPIGPEDCDYESFMDSLTGDGELFWMLYRKLGMSKTRSLMNALLDGIAANVLVTNVYWTPTARDRELSPSQRDAGPFEALMNHVKPRVIVAHGKRAAQVLDVGIGTPIAEQNRTIQLSGSPYETHVFTYPHLSGLGWPKGFRSQPDDMTRLAQRVALEVARGQSSRFRQ